MPTYMIRKVVRTILNLCALGEFLDHQGAEREAYGVRYLATTCDVWHYHGSAVWLYPELRVYLDVLQFQQEELVFSYGMLPAYAT